MEDDDLLEHNCTSFIPTPHREQTELESIQSIITNEDCNLPWPRLSEKPLNEFETEGLATMAFPTLFPYGTGDPTTKNRKHPISYTDFFKHLIRFAKIKNDQIYWRFATHPRFSYWALNLKQRHHLLSQANA